jgi:RHS repeat-associated protein
MSAARKLECFDDEDNRCNLVLAAATTRYARQVVGSCLYDLAGRLKSIRNQATATPATNTQAAQPAMYINDIQYNARGQTTSISHGDGTTMQGFEYDASRGWLKRTYMNNGATNIADMYYARNAKGMVDRINTYNAGVADPERTWVYSYDSLQRLAGASKNGTWAAGSSYYVYDAANNITYNSDLCPNATASPNIVYPAAGQPRPHAPSSICGTPVTYDANGNTLTYDRDGAAWQQPLTLGYDGENRPLTITKNANTTVMAYGADGERVSKNFGTATHYYLGGEGEYLFNLTYTTGMLTSYIHPDVKREGTNIDILMKDHLNSNRVSSRFAGTVTRQDYGPYGQPVSYAGATLPQIGQPQTKGYINEKFDPETGLQYNHFRYMDPDLARFINPDTWDRS